MAAHYERMKEKEKQFLIEEKLRKRDKLKTRLSLLRDILDSSSSPSSCSSSSSHLNERKDEQQHKKRARASVNNNKPAIFNMEGSEEEKREIKRRQNKDNLRVVEQMLAEAEEREREERMRLARSEKERQRKRGRRKAKGSKISNDGGDEGELDFSDEEFCLDEYQSEDEEEERQRKKTEKEEERRRRKRERKKESELYRQLLQIYDRNACSSDEEGEEEAEIASSIRKIYYCSRTHSQLDQFVSEVKKTSFARHVRTVSLGSRKNLCINAQVKRLGSVSRMNDRCLDMIKSEKNKNKKSSISKCPFLEPTSQRLFRDHVLLKVRDIEELLELGEKQKCCPYYGSRAALPFAELVTLPYATLLHKSTRESMGIDLKGNIVVVDEAHNLIDAINEIYSTSLSMAQLMKAHSQLSQYKERYSSRLLQKNLEYIERILFFIRSLIKALKVSSPPSLQPTCKSQKEGYKTEEVSSSSSSSSSSTSSVSSQLQTLSTLNDFAASCKIQHLNLFKIEKYFQRSDIVRKLNGFFERWDAEMGIAVPDEDDEDEAEIEKHRPALGQVEAFLVAMTNANKDGRVVVSRNAQNERHSKVQFVLLNPAAHIKEVVEDAHALILAGGTMQPLSDYVAHLFGPLHQPSPECKSSPSSASTQNDSSNNVKLSSAIVDSLNELAATERERKASKAIAKLHVFSCGHVIPEENLVALILSKGPSDVPFDFTYQSRSSPKLMEELGYALLNLCHVIPDGLVCFFPSYAYADSVMSTWRQSGLLETLNAKKKVFVEPKKAGDIPETLRQYKECITQGNNSSCGVASTATAKGGAMLCSVVGGKMSEGINFSDGLARCIVMVGLPYPNKSDPILQEKIRYISQHHQETQSSSTPGSSFYENLCMRAVNQSIGRAIRHANDYAAIVFIDQRYQRQSVIAKLPKWISSRLGNPPQHVSSFSSSGLSSSPSCPPSVSSSSSLSSTSFGPVFSHLATFFRNKRNVQPK
ncbi:DEAD H (Asp-Glu-Ala-Asp His) box helicase 11, variant 3 [Balamuthia mandrillaris]